jgi:hypothetical protein
MPCIGILGCRVSEEDLPETLRKIIFSSDIKLSPCYHNPKRRNPRGNSPLNIYTIEYNGMALDVYKDSYEDYLKDRIYIIYEITLSNKYFLSAPIEMPLLVKEDFDNWTSNMQKINLGNDIGFFLVEN